METINSVTHGIKFIGLFENFLRKGNEENCIEIKKILNEFENGIDSRIKLEVIAFDFLLFNKLK